LPLKLRRTRWRFSGGPDNLGKTTVAYSPRSIHFRVMKKINFLNLGLILIAIVSLISSFAAIYSDDDPVVDAFCIVSDFLITLYFLLGLASSKGIYYESHNIFIYSDVLIAYLARKEKSPPRNNLYYSLSLN